jgi:hypothetical protein
MVAISTSVQHNIVTGSSSAPNSTHQTISISKSELQNISAGAIAAISVSAVLAILLLMFCAGLVIYRNRRKQRDFMLPEPDCDHTELDAQSSFPQTIVLSGDPNSKPDVTLGTEENTQYVEMPVPEQMERSNSPVDIPVKNEKVVVDGKKKRVAAVRWVEKEHSLV